MSGIYAFITIDLQEPIRCTHCAKLIEDSKALQVDAISNSFNGSVTWTFHLTDFCTEAVSSFPNEVRRSTK